MRTPDTAYLSSALASTETPCVSIYLPTHRAHPDNQQDSIRFRNVVDEVESTLSKSYPVRTTRNVADRLRAIEREPNFWDGAEETLIVLASPARCDAFAVPRKFPERVEVGASFHIKPLLRHVQSAERFHVLGLSRERAALFHGNRYELAPLVVPGVPLTMAETLGTETFEPIHLLQAANRGSRQSASIQHVEGGRKQDVIPDVERLFRTVDRAVTRLVSEPSALSAHPLRDRREPLAVPLDHQEPPPDEGVGSRRLDELEPARDSRGGVEGFREGIPGTACLDSRGLWHSRSASAGHGPG